MKKWLQRVRGAIGMGLTWGVVWSAAGAVPRWVFGIETDVPFPIVFGVLGLGAGVIFSAILTLTEGRRPLDQMSLPRFASWGAVGGVLLSALFVRGASLGGADALVIAPTLALACGVSAAGSLALARRAERRQLAAPRDNRAIGGG